MTADTDRETAERIGARNGYNPKSRLVADFTAALAAAREAERERAAKALSSSTIILAALTSQQRALCVEFIRALKDTPNGN